MTSLTTQEMVGYARQWLATQTNATPRDILQPLYDMSVALLGGDNLPNHQTNTGEANITTPQLLEHANKWLDGVNGLSPKEFLVEIKDATLAIIQQLPKWKCSMFFKGISGVPDSLLNFAGADSSAHRRYGCDAIRRIGGNGIVFIGEGLFNNPSRQAEVDSDLNYAVSVGITHLIISLKNDNQDFNMANMDAYIRQLADHYAGATSEQVAFMTCLESDEVLSVLQTQQMVRCCKQYAPLKRVIVGSANPNFLRAIGNGAEMWLEIHTNPFNLSQADADRYIADLQSLLPYGPVWAGEYWDGSSELSKQISRRALEIGCAGIGSWVS